ncbi:MAG: rane protein [Sphingomonas bacterium]|nr:rane protein [Sphingomonas bacterium]
MSRISIGRAWDEAWAFLRAESALLAPVALATTGVALMILLLVMPDPAGDKLPGGPWLFWLFPVYALMLSGVLGISALVLRPGISVREALLLALRRLPQAAAVVVLFMLISLIAGLPSAVVAAVEARAGGNGVVGALVNWIMLALVIWIWVRVLPIWPLVADRTLPPVAALRHSFALTRGHARRLFGLCVLAGIAAGVLGAALLFAGGAVLMVVGRAVSGAALGTLLVSLLLAVLASVGTTIWTVLIACLYRQLAAARSA